MLSSGRAILFTTIILVLGMGVLIFSDFVASRNFAMLTAFTLSTAVLADLLILPAALMVFRPELPKALEEGVE